MSYFTLRSAHAHVHTPSLYLRNGLTDRAQIYCVVGSLLVTRLSHVMDHISHCDLHVRTCTPHICISGMAWPIALKFVVNLWPNQFARWAVCAVGGLRGGRFARFAFGGWGFVFGGLRLGFGGLRLAVCAFQFAVGGLRLTIGGLRFALDVVVLQLEFCSSL